jgi:biotin/methionine sulfoxide reductase
MLVETDGENVLSSRGALPTQHPNSLQTVVRDQVHSKTRVRWPMVRKGFWLRRTNRRVFAARMSLFA